VTTTATPRAARLGLALALLVIPAAITAAALLVMLITGPGLGATVVTHWGPGGADGRGPAWTFPLLIVGVGLGLPVIAWFASRAAGRVGDAVVFVAATLLWVAVLLTVGMTWALVQQPGAEEIGLPLLVGALAGLVVAVAAWFLLPREPLPADEADTAEALDLAAGERAGWTGSVASPTGLIVAVGAVLLLVLALAVTTIATTGWVAWPSLIALPVLGLASTLLWWRASAGPRGLVVRAAAGWPVFRIPAEDIVEARAVRVEAFSEFGGWGVRWAPGGRGRGRFGVIISSGEAIEVTRRDGRVVVVTIAGASTAVAVLRAYRTA